jgi:hypothetical protein
VLGPLAHRWAYLSDPRPVAVAAGRPDPVELPGEVMVAWGRVFPERSRWQEVSRTATAPRWPTRSRTALVRWTPRVWGTPAATATGLGSLR